jgi:hypothetical protein
MWLIWWVIDYGNWSKTRHIFDVASYQIRQFIENSLCDWYGEFSITEIDRKLVIDLIWRGIKYDNSSKTCHVIWCYRSGVQISFFEECCHSVTCPFVTIWRSKFVHQIVVFVLSFCYLSICDYLKIKIRTPNSRLCTVIGLLVHSCLFKDRNSYTKYQIVVFVQN